MLLTIRRFLTDSRRPSGSARATWRERGDIACHDARSATIRQRVPGGAAAYGCQPQIWQKRRPWVTGPEERRGSAGHEKAGASRPMRPLRSGGAATAPWGHTLGWVSSANARFTSAERRYRMMIPGRSIIESPMPEPGYWIMYRKASKIAKPATTMATIQAHGCSAHSPR